MDDANLDKYVDLVKREWIESGRLAWSHFMGLYRMLWCQKIGFGL